jgi:hypothetical protein
MLSLDKCKCRMFSQPPSPFVVFVLQDMMGFVNQSDVGDLLLKLILCQLPEYKSGRGLTPFWQTNPYNACKYAVRLLIVAVVAL